MFKLFTLFKDQPNDHPPSGEEIAIASGKEVLDAAKAKTWFNNLKAASENVRVAFEKQAEAAAVGHSITFYFTH